MHREKKTKKKSKKKTKKKTMNLLLCPGLRWYGGWIVRTCRMQEPFATGSARTREETLDELGMRNQGWHSESEASWGELRANPFHTNELHNHGPVAHASRMRVYFRRGVRAHSPALSPRASACKG